MIGQKICGRWNLWLILASVIFFSATLSCTKNVKVPEELIGTWKTSDIRYSGTFFAIDKGTLTFQDKNGEKNSYTLIRITRESIEDRNWMLYTFHYLDRDLKKVEFPFYFRSSETMLIRFRHQPSLVWKKEG